MSAIARDTRMICTTHYKPIDDDNKKIIIENVFTNSLNVLGYIPGVSTISGLARIIFGSIMLSYIANEDREAIIHYTNHIKRGALEALPIIYNNIALAISDKIICDYLNEENHNKGPNVNDTEKWFNL